MSKPIIITRNIQIQIEAASIISQELGRIGIKHAFIGGFAASFFGGQRETEDIDILVEISAEDVHEIARPKLTQQNPHFNQVNLEYYFTPQLIGDLQGEELVRASDCNVKIEMIPTKTLGLPPQAGPIIFMEGDDRVATSETSNNNKIPVIHPSVLVLTKMKRWVNIYQSTRPKSIVKSETDRSDIEALLSWLKEKNLQISFTEYHSQNPVRLDVAVKEYAEFLKAEGHDEEWDRLVKVVADVDWKRIFSQ